MKNGDNDLAAHLAELDRLRARRKIGRRDHQAQRANAESAAAGGRPLPPVRISAARKWAGRAADLLAGGLVP